MTNRRDVLIGIAGISAAAGLSASGPVLAAVIPRTERFMMPDIMTAKLDARSRIADEFNTYTLIHERVTRWTVEDGKLLRIEIARVGGDRYRQWLAEDPPEDGIPPHVQFGGAIVAGPGDPTFKSRWEQRTLARIAAGEFAW